MVKILDCTTRDGGFCTNWNFSENFIFDLLNCQNMSNISFYEIGYRNYLENENKGAFYNCTQKFLEKFYEKRGNTKIGVMTDTKRFSIKDFTDRKNDFIDFIRIACHPDKIEETLYIAENLYANGYEIFIQLMDISNVDNSGYKILENWNSKKILNSLYCADSYGNLTPQHIESCFNKLKEIGYEKISFHGHNNSQMALKNTLKAIDLGAYSVDITLNGIGRSGGNLDAEELLTSLEGYTPENYKKLSDTYSINCL